MTLIGSDSHIAKVYSQTLFELASQQKLVDTVKNDLDILAELITDEEDFLAFMTSPYFSLEQKKQLLQKICGNFNVLTLNFLMVAASHNRISALPSIIKDYEKLYQDYHNYCDIHATVSQALTSSELEALKTSLAAAMNNDKIILETAVDPSIIGGIIIRYSDKVIDNSVRNRLHRAVDTLMTQGKYQEKAYEI
jgi:F-type H+-transporting ATPase subunit delta